MIFNSKLSDDNSLTDKLVINGDSEGDTNVIVNNLGGTGSQTLNGIEIITVKGNSNGVFTQYGRIVAGAYDYNLIKNGNDWYLVSTIPPVDPVEPP
ncbi:autotransporter outer membrane beta-barrel domain-containing protein, partial [Citrobacter werkmanii]|nr:autotransporter outer membrane beta-barrel domain-containing protein [Citrobacter werkmanii]HEB0857249.1 autotransporter outer membrane beta-barrel domain-containing protein [Citrobacter freundii]